MVNINKHKFFLTQILKDIYSDIELANSLGFKGGTALMFFYDLPRFSIDLDFNLLYLAKEKTVYEKVRKILQKQTPINKEIVEARMEIPLADYIQKCIDHLESMSDRGILNGLGELMDEDMKKFVRTKLRTETTSLLRFYKEFPILA